MSLKEKFDKAPVTDDLFVDMTPFQKWKCDVISNIDIFIIKVKNRLKRNG